MKQGLQILMTVCLMAPLMLLTLTACGGTSTGGQCSYGVVHHHDCHYRYRYNHPAAGGTVGHTGV